MIGLYPDNDLVLEFNIRKVNTTTGKSEPVTSGTVTAFLSDSSQANATAADATLEVTPVHVGNGRWLATWQATALTRSLLGSKFAAATPYAHCVVSGDVRRYVQLAYSTSAPAST